MCQFIVMNITHRKQVALLAKSRFDLKNVIIPCVPPNIIGPTSNKLSS